MKTMRIHSTIFLTLPLLFLPQTTHASWAEATLHKLTDDEKIGQLFMVPAVSDEQLNKEFMQEQVYTMDKEYVEDVIKRYKPGGIIFAGIGTAQKQFERTQQFQQLSTVPLLIGQDLEPGLLRIQDLIKFPRNMTLGAMHDEQLIYQTAAETARQAQQLGVHIIFAPVVCVNNNPKNPVINDRSFGQDPNAVARKAMLFMRGLQDNGILACAKHFPGHGDTHTDSHYDLPRVEHPLERLESVELPPFKTLINGGVKAVMMAQLEVPALESVPNVPSSLSHATITGLLRNKLGFTGLIVTDGLGMKGVTKHHALGELELKAIKAGNDMLVMSVDIHKAFATIKQAVNDGTLPRAELDAHVLQILRAKEWALSKANMPATLNQAALHPPYAYALKKKLYQEAMTITRNDHNDLPLKTNDPVTVIQIGGSAHNPFVAKLQEKVNCTHHALSAQPTQEQLNQITHTGNTIIIALFDMNKFAAQQFGIAHTTHEYVNALQAQGKKVILTLFGSPYSTALFKDISATLVAYDNDPDAQVAAAQVILGTLQAKGTLPVVPDKK